ncbi:MULTISPECIES: metallophosphoesterase family protein [Methylobacterium]|uniref:3',5'-cyclic adenosine monophosphate phosphodiesterase CpdA n=1 Tax=Methylobacterium bullatum TaxID=570505 RepID=A0A679K2F4_9HYPH|nr:MULTISPECIES: metallophosphoesterase [Methylobacterium]KQO41174.1 metallophosphatase [Methylobacterium sp. Leaf85]MBD8900831.1 metallophosphatase [Methylobacterium bullatum]GJD40995.1 3',5'-cyclic adenosine monophosphate phosphodiesterase CpdA [Methylobacterium bullatum]CAA2143626.1 3',5'-cyclic adenosine monophosphate phosphodiesterase CpdA [Methylobacterium bullatum]
MFRLAHLTDPHVGPIARPRLRQLLSKRATGYVNWRRGRSRHHDMEILAALVADLRTQPHDHVACTGDLCNIGLPSEWATARDFLQALGTPDTVSFVPGNHDAYVRGSLEGLLKACGAWTSGDDGTDGVFPYLRRRGPLALIGVSSAIPTKPFVASGRLGPPQIETVEAILTRLGREPEPPFRVVMIHHPPQPGGASPGRELKDAETFTAMIGRAGADLILHGHNHVGSIGFVRGPDGTGVPVVGAPSASAVSHGGALHRRASYHVYAVTRADDRYVIEAKERGLTEAGTIADLRVLKLTRR